MGFDVIARVTAPLRAMADRVLSRIDSIDRHGQQLNATAAGLLGQGATIQHVLSDYIERSLMLNGRMAASGLSHGRSIADLSEVEFRVFSQWGEDGIIEWLVTHVPLPNTRFVEFGVGNFYEANCRFLLLNRNWKGLVMDSSTEYMTGLRNDAIYWKHDLTAAPAFVSVENINGLISDHGFTGPLGILSIDIDGNDYWIWKAITCVDPAIVICEYNPIFGDTHAISIPYDAHFTRFAGHSSGLYFGCSIAALRSLAEQRGYTFVGTNSNGINAFFVRNDLAASVLPLLGECRAYPSRHRDSRDDRGQLSYTGGAARFDLIRHLPVIEVTTGETITLGEIAAPYSDRWLEEML
jgi:hypothetical protein